ncbi:hypothetical protein K1W69_17715 [Hoeflea sp. WL0058]|uniref:Uncharacterized protein n=1 Tax=Flavimaribacter sediminis TaxID=2865987 RepID=A0AAE3D2Y5_9HYPH|nr:phage capsid protein [Flavimaribacter sediminis]MBW8639038.1 hypothetical protein [Flavimaribacter sediminis]
MADQIEAWFRELIKDKVTVAMQAHGGMLDGTMMSGDTQANTVKFPIIGRTEVYKLTGAIEPVPTSGPDLTTVQVTLEDFEASAWWRTQDAYKAGPSEKDSLSKILTYAVRRKRDTIKLDAVATFAEVDEDVSTIGDGTDIPDLLHFEQGRAEISGAGASAEDEEGGVFVPMPAMWFSQLKFYKEFADAQWVGSEDAPFSKRQRTRMRTLQGVTYIECPDEYFTGPDATSLYTHMWAKPAMGAETPWNQEQASLSQHQELQGSPWLAKTGVGGAAIGIQGKAVKRFWLKKITAPTRPE